MSKSSASMDPIPNCISEEVCRREQCVEDAIRNKVLRVFAGLEFLVDLDQDPGQLENSSLEGVLDLTASFNRDERRNHSMPKWSELKIERKVHTSTLSRRRPAEDSSPSTQNIQPLGYRSEPIANKVIKTRYRPSRKIQTEIAVKRSNSEGDQIPLRPTPPVAEANRDAAIQPAPSHPARPRGAPRAAGEHSGPAAACVGRTDATAQQRAASSSRRVRFAAQLEEDPPSPLHSPRRATAGGRGAYAARILRAVSRSFTRALRRASS